MTNQTLTVTVTELNGLIKSVLEGLPVLRKIVVKGEISNLTVQQHIYFTLKDDESTIKAVMFRSAASELDFKPQNGMKVTVTGHVGVYAKSGSYQLYCDEIEQDGVGALYIAFEKLKAKLAAEGLFDESHKKPLPKIPFRVGLITAPTGAAVRDMIDVTRRRFPAAQLILCPSLVQGTSAPAQLIEAVKTLDGSGLCDVIIIGRGGGSIEDLWAFNDEALARAVYACKTPIISAVGHEIDFTICDFVADRRAPTPSAAAEIAVPDKRELLKKFDNLQSRFDTLVKAKIDGAKLQLGRLSERQVLVNPLYAFDEKRVLIDKLQTQMLSAVSGRVETDKQSLLRLADRLQKSCGDCVLTQKQRIEVLSGRLSVLSPLAVLDRGYAAVYKDGEVVAKASELVKGDKIKVRFADGSKDAEITD